MNDCDLARLNRIAVEQMFIDLMESGTVPMFLIAEVPDSEKVIAHVFSCVGKPDDLHFAPCVRGILNRIETGTPTQVSNTTTLYDEGKEKPNGE